MPLETYPFDAARYIDEQGERQILADAVATGDPNALRVALDVVARSRGMTELARQAGISRRDLFEAVFDHDAVDVERLVNVFKALATTPQDTEAAAAE